MTTSLTIQVENNAAAVLQPIDNVLYAMFSRFTAIQAMVNTAMAKAQAQEQLSGTVEGSGASYDSLLSKIGRVADEMGVKTHAKNMVKQTYESAVALEATQARYQAAFGGMTEASDQFIADYQQLTPATIAEARTMASGMQEFLVPLGMQRTEASQTTGEMMHLVGALTNFNGAGVSSGDVTGSLMSAMSGEYEALKSLGIQMDESMVKQQAVAMGLSTSTNSVSDAARAQAVLSLAYQQSGSALSAYNENSLSTAYRMQILQKGFQDAFGVAGQTLLPKINVLLEKVKSYMPLITAGITGVVNAFGGILEIGGMAFDVLMGLAAGIMENWYLIGPIVAGVTAAVIAYNAALTIGNVILAMATAAKNIYATATMLAGGATSAATVGQTSLNAALLACPITWIIILIMMMVAALYAVVAGVNHFAGTSISATGIITGCFGALGAFLYNTIIVRLWNAFAAFGNFLYNVWNDPVAAIRILFYDLAVSAIGYMLTMAQGIEDVINKIPGVEVNLTAGLTNLKNDIESISKEVKDESGWKEIIASKSYLDISETTETAYQWGAEKEDSFKSIFNGGGDAPPLSMPGTEFQVANQNAMDNTAANTGNTAGNTAAMANAMDIMEEDLKYMRDAAEQEIINRFTLAELKVDMTNNNTLKTETDFDRMTGMIAEVTSQILASSAEGGHL